MNKTIRSFATVTGFSVVTRLISFVFKIWMSRALGAEAIGLYQIAMSVMMMLFTLTSGAPTVLSRKIAEATGNDKRQNALATASLILGTVTSCALFGIFFGLREKLGFLFSDPRCLPIFAVMLPTLVTSTLYASFRGWFWGRKNFVAFSSTELIDEVVKIVLSAVFAAGLVAGVSGAYGIALAMTISDAVCVLVLAALYFIAGGRFVKPSGFGALIKGSVPLSATRMITSLTTSLTAVALPRLLVGYGMTASEAIAEYGRASGMALPLILAPMMLISSMSVVLIPDVAQLRAGGKLDGVRSKLSASMNFATLVACAFFVVYLSLGKQIGYLLFKDAKAGEFVSYCSFMLFPIAIAQVTTPMLNSLGKEKFTFLSSLAGSAVTIPCILFLPKVIGVYAVAAGSAACFTLISIMNLVKLRRILGRFSSPSGLLKTTAFALPLALAGFFAQRLVAGTIGTLATTLTVGVLELFLFVLFLDAFKLLNVSGYLRLIPLSRASEAHARKVKTVKKTRGRTHKRQT